MTLNNVRMRYVSADVVFSERKTAHEMRISEWSSDVCASDLGADRRGEAQQFVPMGPDMGDSDRISRHPGQQRSGFLTRQQMQASVFYVAQTRCEAVAEEEIGRAHV